MTLGKYKKVYGIILEISVKEEIDKIAKNDLRSSSNLINKILKDYLKSIESGEGEK